MNSVFVYSVKNELTDLSLAPQNPINANHGLIS